MVRVVRFERSTILTVLVNDFCSYNPRYHAIHKYINKVTRVNQQGIDVQLPVRSKNRKRLIQQS